MRPQIVVAKSSALRNVGRTWRLSGKVALMATVADSVAVAVAADAVGVSVPLAVGELLEDVAVPRSEERRLFRWQLHYPYNDLLLRWMVWVMVIESMEFHRRVTMGSRNRSFASLFTVFVLRLFERSVPVRSAFPSQSLPNGLTFARFSKE